MPDIMPMPGESFESFSERSKKAAEKRFVKK
jgi:hypothetical protein